MDNYNSNPTMENVTFNGNSATNHGGGMNNWSNSNPTMTNVTFINNASAYQGGGLYNRFTNPTLTNVTFKDNSSDAGGGMYNWYSDNPRLTNVTFSGNTTWVGGGIYNNNSNPILTNATFKSNVADLDGGGIYNNNSDPTIYNTIFWGNTATRNGAQVYNLFSTPIMADSVVDGGCPTNSNCTNIITSDPVLGVPGNYGGYTQTTPLLPGSSAIDTGNNNYCPSTDQRGVARPQGTSCDIGAFELEVANPTIAVSIDVKPGSDTNPINPKSKGKIPVAILSMPDFDAPSMVDVSSLTFGKHGNEESLVFCNQEGEDVNGDGLLDLVCHFDNQLTLLNNPKSSFGYLEGNTMDGTPLEGSDTITILN